MKLLTTDLLILLPPPQPPPKIICDALVATLMSGMGNNKPPIKQASAKATTENTIEKGASWVLAAPLSIIKTFATLR